MPSTPAEKLSEQELVVSKADIVAAWSALERFVISVRKIGGKHALPTGAQQTIAQTDDLHRDIGIFVTDQMFGELNQLRVKLGSYLPDEEFENISDSLSYWEPSER